MKKFIKLFGFIVVLMFMMITMSTVSFAQNSNETFLIHEYNFDNDNGTTVVNAVSNGANGTATGTNLIPGYGGTGYARSFNGSSYITFSDKVFPMGKKSIAFKIRKTSISEIPSGKGEFFMGNAINSSTDYGTCGYVDSNGRMVILCCNSGAKFGVKTSKSIYDNNWHDILYTWDGTTNTNSVKLYVDNMAVPDCTVTANFIEKHVGSYNLNLGSLAQGVAPYKFVGDIDDFQVYNNVYLNNPTNLKSISGNTKVDLIWDTISDATNYNIYRSETSGTGYEKIDSTTSGITRYIDKSVTNGTTYYYVVTAENASCESSYSNEISQIPQPSKQLTLVLEVNEAKQLSVNEQLSNNSEVDWTSFDSAIATVDANGNVKALKPGDSMITCTSNDTI